MTPNKHGYRGSRWVTVPNFFPEWDDLEGDTYYHLFEGYGVSYYETKPSGKHYKKVRTPEEDSVDNALMYLNYLDWHKEYYLKKSRIPFCSGWRRKEKTDA